MTPQELSEEKEFSGLIFNPQPEYAVQFGDDYLAGVAVYSSLLPDYPYAAEKEWPKNYDGSMDMHVTMARALRRSKNTTAIHMADALTPELCFDYMLRSSFTHLLGNDATVMGMGLGYMDSGVTVSEMNAAYAMFGNGGLYYAQTFVTLAEVNGETVYEHHAQPHQVYSAETAWIMNRMMKSNVDMEEGLGVNAAIEDVEVFGKTGTTDRSNVVDNTWFVRGTPDNVAAVWIGLDEQEVNNGMPSTTKMWNLVMEQLGSEHAEFTPAKDVQQAEFCSIFKIW